MENNNSFHIKRRGKISKPSQFQEWFFHEFLRAILWHGMLLSFMVYFIGGNSVFTVLAYGILYYYIKSEFVYWVRDLRNAWTGRELDEEVVE